MALVYAVRYLSGKGKVYVRMLCALGIFKTRSSR